MRRKLLYFATLFALTCTAFFVGVSCTKDLGNYEYHDLVEPEITLEGSENDIHILTHQRLKLQPDLGGEGFTSDLYDFEWRAIAQNESQSITVIGDKKDLDYEVKLKAGEYLLLFKVIERSTGIFWQADYNLIVSEVTSEGWMVLCSEGPDARVRLDMVSEVTGETLNDLLIDNKDMPVMHNPHSLVWLTGTRANPEYPFYILTEEGGLRLGRNSFEWKPNFSFEYETGGGNAINPQCIVPLANARMMVCNNKLYYSDCMVTTGIFGKIDGQFTPAPRLGTNLVNNNIIVPTCLFFDCQKGCFMTYSRNLMSADMGGYSPLHSIEELEEILRSSPKGGKITGDAFKDYPSGAEYVYMENTLYDPNKTNTGVTYTILKEEGRLHLYGIRLGELMGGISLGGPVFALSKDFFADITDCPEIANATAFAFSSLTRAMYYAVGNKVYKTEFNGDTPMTKLQFTLQGEQIQVLKFNIYQTNKNMNKSYDLVVGSIDNQGYGILRTYEGFNSKGNFTKPSKVYKRLGKLVDVLYREMVS